MQSARVELVPGCGAETVTAGSGAGLSAAVATAESVPLVDARGSHGTFNLYADQVDASDDPIVDTVGWLAAQLGMAVAAVNHVSHLAHASRGRTVGEAQRIVMERHRFDADQASALLSRRLQARNIKRRQTAADLVETGVVPPVTARPPRRRTAEEQGRVGA